MNTILIFAWVWAAFIAMSIWEASVEGRNAWDKGKHGPKIKILGIVLTTYHFFLAWIMLPMLIIGLPLIIFGWNLSLFGILTSAYLSGLIIEDFGWYIFNPKVKLKEFYSPFSDYYPWIKIGNKKIIPLFYILGIILAIIIYLLTT